MNNLENEELAEEQTGTPYIPTAEDKAEAKERIKIEKAEAKAKAEEEKKKSKPLTIVGEKVDRYNAEGVWTYSSYYTKAVVKSKYPTVFKAIYQE